MGDRWVINPLGYGRLRWAINPLGYARLWAITLGYKPARVCQTMGDRWVINPLGYGRLC